MLAEMYSSANSEHRKVPTQPSFIVIKKYQCRTSSLNCLLNRNTRLNQHYSVFNILQLYNPVRSALLYVQFLGNQSESH